MARKKRDEIQEHDIGGLKYFDKLEPLLERLHDDGCLRDKAGKPTLRTCEMLCYYLMGWADEATLTAHITKLQQHDLAKRQQHDAAKTR